MAILKPITTVSFSARKHNKQRRNLPTAQLDSFGLFVFLYGFLKHHQYVSMNSTLGSEWYMVGGPIGFMRIITIFRAQLDGSSVCPSGSTSQTHPTAQAAADTPAARGSNDAVQIFDEQWKLQTACGRIFSPLELLKKLRVLQRVDQS